MKIVLNKTLEVARVTVGREEPAEGNLFIRDITSLQKEYKVKVGRGAVGGGRQREKEEKGRQKNREGGRPTPYRTSKPSLFSSACALCPQFLLYIVATDTM